jgi:outer membrane protein insertion porin family
MNRWVAPLLLTAAHTARLALPAAALAAISAHAQQDGVIRDIRIEGTQRIEPGTVLSYMTLKPGDRFDAAQEDASLKNLFGTGLFADVTLRRDGNVLVVLVAENPIVNRATN